jgi:hypothetical protein
MSKELMRRLGRVSFLLPLVAAVGCASHAPRRVAPPQYYLSMGLCQPKPVETVLAECDPPTGWIPQPLHKSERHTHQIWVSPSGKTAYGVMHFKMPLPVGVSVVHWEFLREMKKKEGEAIEISERMDPALPGMRFVCEGGRYKMRVSMTVRGFEGWAAYAATLRAQPVDQDELELAEQARENTVFGLDEGTVSAGSTDRLSDARTIPE